eukprot:CAMPEP_0178928594 /NCGR_PEP_ID=MMETSP0786-20121207/20004_1 /TAXON_ID=186022 /ORGANISM="Thalassionema frauenfeldii, Strain CCMP 1798" /LENGTH=33 /DNA_ID= /DNA_START= /DNA_END= /DNA_ORIENTATION=
MNMKRRTGPPVSLDMSRAWRSCRRICPLLAALD